MEKLGNYYNSDLNKHIGETLPKIMTSIDLDLLQVKQSRKIIRLAEYKHTNEKIGYQQNKTFEILGKIAKEINKNSDLFDGWKMQVCLIRGDEPYNKIKIKDYILNKDYIFENKEQIAKFLCVEEV